MIGLISSILIFNYAAIKLNKRLSKNEAFHIYVFTIAFQALFDTFVDIKYTGYWYFTKAVDWVSLLYMIFLVSPVNVIFINYFPVHKSFSKKVLNLILWNFLCFLYELISLLPEPWGYFHYGWWEWYYSLLLNPVLLLILITYYHFFVKLDFKKST
ncbi:hypothetical protein [Niallia taxi]|uniref:Uncharacterized protein n=1 Tax=Niallia taxi TaxID=2499688 RepID=A0A3S3SNP0_9BACI|nr:hypothetical protein [Niallia taxi]RVT67647.1 hypothetical protein EM808_04005 [Niallia taxi]